MQVSNWHVSEGFVAYNGEIWYVAAADVTKVTGTRLYSYPIYPGILPEAKLMRMPISTIPGRSGE